MALFLRIRSSARLLSKPSLLHPSANQRYFASSSDEDSTGFHGIFPIAPDPTLQSPVASSQQMSAGFYSPVDAASACLDCLHDLTGLPWYFPACALSIVFLLAVLFGSFCFTGQRSMVNVASFYSMW